MYKRTSFFSVFTLLFCLLPILFSLIMPKFSYAQESASEADYDYILIIDESGSMKKNDPDNTRIEAAKLFVDLNTAFAGNSRVCVIGFGQKVNVYFELQYIRGNEEAIRLSLDNIKSDQPLTDMKAAFLKAQKILEAREQKNNSAIIFLTDGALTLDDIPKEDNSDKTERPQTEREQEGPVRIRPSEKEDENPLDNKNMHKKNIENKPSQYQDREKITSVDEGQGSPQTSYLEKYKKDLLAICFDLSLQNTGIYPIAFTEEAQIQLLQDMAFITGNASTYAESAKDLKEAYLDIFGKITNSFILAIEQQGADPVTGTIALKDYIKRFFIIAFRNDNDFDPSIEISATEKLVSEQLKERQYEILQVTGPSDTDLSYKIEGDGVFLFDIARSAIIEPQKSYYLLDAEIPLTLQLTPLEEMDKTTDYGDFDVQATFESSEGIVEQDIDLTPLADKEGVFGSILKESSLQGTHAVEFTILHKPTGATSSKKILLDLIDLGIAFAPLLPSGTIEIDSEEDLWLIPVQAKIESKQDEGLEHNISDMKVICLLTDEKGMLVKEILLTAEEDSDGATVFAADSEAIEKEGIYHAAFFILDPRYGDNKIGTAKGLTFELKIKDAPKEDASEKIESAAEGQPDIIDIEKNEPFPYRSLLIAASAVLGGIIVAVIAFLLYLKFRNKNTQA